MVLPNDVDLPPGFGFERRKRKKKQHNDFQLSHSLCRDIICLECCYETTVCLFSKDLAFCAKCRTPLGIPANRLH